MLGNELFFVTDCVAQLHTREMSCGNMTKILRCADIMPSCDFEATAETEAALLDAAAAHAKAVHGIEATPDVIDKVRGVIKEVMKP